MNDQARKVIKSSFCPKQKWVSDNEVQNCFKCDKKFQTLYRRKHHCRYCGQVFCNICSDFFFDGKDLGETEKQIRMCNSCYQKCWKYLVKHDQSYIEFRKSNEDQEEKIPNTVEELQFEKSYSFTEEDKIVEIRKIINDYNLSELEKIKELEKKVDKKFIILMQVIMKDKKIPLKYLSPITDVIMDVVNRIQPNALFTNNMNICKNIKISCFHSEQDFSIQLSSKILVKKNFQIKRIKQQFENAKCILLYGGLESQDLVGGQKLASFQQMVSNRTKEVNKVISYCQRLEICLIFLEGNIEKQFDDKFYNSGIFVIPKIKIDHLQRLKIGLNIEKIVSSAHELYEYTKQEIVGVSKMITSEMEMSIKGEMKTKRFFAIQSVKDELGMIIKIKGKHSDMLQTLKKELSQMIMLLKHMRLKVHKVLMDQQLLNSMTEQMRTQCYLHNPEMFFNLYNEHHSDILNYLKVRYLSYKQISYTGSQFQNYPEVTKPGLDEYLYSRGHSFRNKWDYFTDICGEINQQHRRFYSEDDVPVGVYLLKKFTSIDKKCLTCARPNYNHIDIFYSTDHYVKIWTQSRIPELQKDNHEVYIVLEQQNQENQLDILFKQLSKTKEKTQLQCYIQCQKCQEVLSAKIQLTHGHLEYSMIAFVNHFFMGTVKTTIRQNNQKRQDSGKQSCPHIDKVRVIQMGDKYLKIYVGNFILSRLCVLTKTGRKNFLQKKEISYCLQYCLLQVNKIDQIVMFLLEEIKSIAEGSKNTKFDKMIRDPKSSFIKAKNSIIGNSNLRLSQAQCIDMILPEVIEEIIKINTLAGMLLNPKKVSKLLECEKIYYVLMTFLKKIYVIIIELKKSIKRRELDMKYEAKDFDNDFIMDQIDINQLADSSNFSEGLESESQIHKSQLFSSTQDYDKREIEENYDWLQPFDSNPIANKNQRKTVYNRRNTKATQAEATEKFKQIASFIRVEPAFFDFVPCYSQLPQTLIASALNSQIHKESLFNSLNVPTQLLIKMNKIIETTITVQHEELRKLQIIIQIQERMFDIGNKVKKMINGIPYQIAFLYPQEFELIRRKDEISIELFIQSIAGAESWLASGGKSGSPFMRSFNDLIVIKKITLKEFLTFKKFLPEYFTHLHNGSLLVPIYGAYTIVKNSTKNYYIAMKNLFFGMKDWYIYDMKGSVTRRFSKWPVIPLDINFLIDRNSEPIFCKDNILKNLFPTLDYLVKNNIVDYSLILVVEIQNQSDYYMDGNRFHIGVVDYLRQFGAVQMAQRLWKGSACTVQQPIDYRNRMYKNLRKYFTQIPL